MNFFGRKQKTGALNMTSARKKKTKPTKNKRVYKKPPDVKLFYRMPMILTIGILCILVGSFIAFKNNSEYRQKILASSMPKGTTLPIRAGTSGNGKLTLGNSKLSADGKTLAVEIQYNEEAHSYLSSFGENYKLVLIDTEKHPMKEAKLSYGMFSTDGSGVLTIKKEDGFENAAFMVFLIDKGIIMSNDELGTPRTMTNNEIEKSLAKQLEEMENADLQKNARTTDKKDTLPPTYMIRLNAFNAQKTYRNWQNDSELVEDLFVDDTLKKIRKNQEELKQKVKTGQQTLDEMNKRLEKNENDTTAQKNKEMLENTIKTLEGEQKEAESNYKKISQSNIKNDILEPKQESMKRFTVTDLNIVK